MMLSVPHFKSFCGYSLISGVYVSCAMHLLIGLCFAIISDESRLNLIGFAQMWIVINSALALFMNSAFCLWLMIAYQSVIAICCGIIMIVSFGILDILMSFAAGLCFGLEMYFILITINLYNEMIRHQIGYVISGPPETSESNSVPQVSVQPPASNNVPVQSNLPNHIVVQSSDPESAVNGASFGVAAADPHSYLPGHVQPAFNPDFVQFCYPNVHYY